MSVRPKKKICLRELHKIFNKSDIDDSDNDPNFSPNKHDEDLYQVLHQLALNKEQEHEEDFVGESVETQSWNIWTGKQQRFPYTGQGKLKIDLSSDISPKRIFAKLVDLEVLTLIVNETNRYALQNEASNCRRSSGDQQWKPTDVQEMIKLLGLNISIGLDRRGMIVSYWSTLPIHKNEVAFNTMSSTTFKNILPTMKL